VLVKHHPKIGDKLDVVFALAKAWVSSGSDDDFEVLEKYMERLKPDEALMLASGFSNMLNLHNINEESTDSHLERAERVGDLQRATRSTDDAVRRLLRQGVPADQIYSAVTSQVVDLVLTAHPTQCLRRSTLKRNAEIRRLLARLHTYKLSSYEKVELKESLQAHVEALYRSDELNRRKPTPQAEMRHGLSYFQETIFHGATSFMRRLDTTLRSHGLPPLPLDCQPFRFGSWMGGDRDGNPFVTPAITRDVVLIARLAAANLLYDQVQRLMFDLSLWRCNESLLLYAREMSRSEQSLDELIAAEGKRRNYQDFWLPAMPEQEPYRVILQRLRDRLYDTREVLVRCLAEPSINTLDALQAANCYVEKEDLLEPLKIMYESLMEVGDEYVANDRLLDLIRQVQIFGLCLVTLDIRQESTRHAEAMGEIVAGVGLGDYASWDEQKRQEFLLQELEGKRPLVPRGFKCTSATSADVLDTFQALTDLPYESMGAYVISMARAASDVLAVMLLQREYGCNPRLRVVPLFETLDDLSNAPATMRELFSNDWYRDAIHGKQEIMLGYSDSGKDAGRFAAAYALYRAQEALVEVGNDFGVQITFFHGRGGTVGRGGGPCQLAVRSQPPGTINGNLRVTIQGEIIESDFGDMELCFRTLDMYTAATLEHGLDPPIAPKPEWRQAMEELARLSCASFRKVVYEDPQFVRFFKAATPETEIGRMNIGSRPSKRRPSAGIESLRAIPWIFAWTQTRFHLPVWLGSGEAIQAVQESGKGPLLREMHREWPFFKVMIDFSEMVFAKADPKIALMYQKGLVPEDLWDLGDRLQKRFVLARDSLLSIVTHDDILGSENRYPSTLREKIKMREAYLAPLNILQVMYLKRLRSVPPPDAGCSNQLSPSESGYNPGDEEIRRLLKRNENHGRSLYLSAVEDTVTITMKGIAAGMQNTG
jgi:phosphoenolpyruvate carboxylase